MRGPQVMKGYWNNDDATGRRSTTTAGSARGDAGYLDDDGYLYIHDRVKDMIVSGGENVYPAEVENVLMGHPPSPTSPSSACPTRSGARRAKAIVVRAAGADADARGDHRLQPPAAGGYKCPTRVEFVDALPRNPSGKILKKDLREPYWAGRDRRVS